MKWVVGLDLRERSIGAVHFARWLASAASGTRFVGVHVLEQEHLLAVLRDHHLDEVLSGARRAAEAAVANEGAAAELTTVDIVQALNTPAGLCDAATRLQADGILLGRAAPREGQRLVRLGRVARRLLRMSTLPAIVVPPDMRAADFAGDGPVIGLTKLTDDSVAPCSFAGSMARALGRRLVIVHVIEAPSVASAQYVASVTLDRVQAERRAEAESAMARWIESCGVRADATELLVGNVVEAVTELADQRRAALLVAGSRHGGSTLERLLVASTASELAAAATRPVAVVPPPSRLS
jgi:nucleotide-binding universal stress UspA family protein